MLQRDTSTRLEKKRPRDIDLGIVTKQSAILLVATVTVILWVVAQGQVS